MRSYIQDERFVVAISHMEACRLNDGEVIADRENPLVSDAKVEVHPLSHYDPTYKPIADFGIPEYMEKLQVVRCIAVFFTNSDLEIYVPPEVSRDVRISAEHIPRERVITLLDGDEHQALLRVLPVNGVTIRFDHRDYSPLS